MEVSESTFDPARLHELLRLDEETGYLYWRSHPRAYKGLIGQRAGCCNGKGYRQVRVLGSRFLAHRIVFAMTHGRWPDQTIDHINGEKDDNRPCNLQDVTVNANNALYQQRKAARAA